MIKIIYSGIKAITPYFVKLIIYKILSIKIINEKRVRYRSKGIFKDYLSKNDIKKLNIGCGKNQLEGWLNTDFSPTSENIAFINAEKELPFNDSTFDYVYTEHLIEHFDYHKAQLFLSEIYRVLKSKGRIRIVTPNLMNLINLFDRDKSQTQENFIKWVSEEFLVSKGVNSKNIAFVLDQYIRGWGHKFLFDYKTLSETMMNTGFIDCNEFKINNSKDSVFKNIEMHGVVINNVDMNEFESLVAEATKP